MKVSINRLETSTVCRKQQSIQYFIYRLNIFQSGQITSTVHSIAEADEHFMKTNVDKLVILVEKLHYHQSGNMNIDPKWQFNCEIITYTTTKNVNPFL